MISKLRLALIIGAIIVATLPEKVMAQAIVVSTHKIVPRHRAHDRSWRQSLRALQYQFDHLIQLGLKRNKIFGNPRLVALQRTSRTRPKAGRKLYQRRLDKIEKILKKMHRTERAQAIKNLRARIANLKIRLGRS